MVSQNGYTLDLAEQQPRPDARRRCRSRSPGRTGTR